MSIADEIRRLSAGPSPEEKPGGVGVVAIVGHCKSDADAACRRLKEIMRAILTASLKPWPPVEEWREQLPEWFVLSFAPEMTREEAMELLTDWRAMSLEEKREYEQTRKWSLADWLHWMQPSERQWEFWNCTSSETHVVQLTIKVDGWPIAHGALDWMLRVAGAERVAVVVSEK